MSVCLSPLYNRDLLEGRDFFFFLIIHLCGSVLNKVPGE